MKPTINTRSPNRFMQTVHDAEFKIHHNVTDESISIYLYGEVGSEYDEADAMGVSQLISQNRGKPLTLRVNSMGGLAFDGVAIHNAIAQHDAETTGIIEGVAASAASTALVGCDVVKCHANAVFHIHEALALAYGHAWEIRNVLDWLDALDEQTMQTMADHSGQDLATVAKQYHGPGGDGTVFTAQKAKAAGYVHEIIGGKNKETAASVGDALRAHGKLKLRKRQLELTRSS